MAGSCCRVAIRTRYTSSSALTHTDRAMLPNLTLIYSSAQTHCLEVSFILQASIVSNNALFTTRFAVLSSHCLGLTK